MKKIKKILELFRKPSSIKFFIIKKLGRKISQIFNNSPFYLQEQMDININSSWYKPEFIDQAGGFFIAEENNIREIASLETWDNVRKDMIVLFLRTIIKNDVKGDFAELGVYQGNTAKLIHAYAPERTFHLFDTFAGFEKRNTDEEKNNTGLEISKNHFADTNLELVKKNINPNQNVFFYKGYFPESVPVNMNNIKFAFVHLDADLYEPTLNGLKYFYPKMNIGGIIVVHDYNSWIGARKATDLFFNDKKEKPIPMPDKSGSAIIIKQ